jgi:Fe-S-cluster containining protein
MSHACQSCGACCASFRVSFYWGETDAHEGGAVPFDLTMPVAPHYVAMRGTGATPVRCIALEGQIGCSVSCGIYERRSSTCRDFEEGTPECAKARAIHGLPALDALS